MLYLLAVSILWGFSFGLVKTEFSGLSPATLATARLLIALPVFLPFLQPRFRRVNRTNLKLLTIGSIQFGFMYIALFSAFKWLTGYEVALLTIFTPLYVIAAYAVLARKFPPIWFWLTAILAVLGALWVLHPDDLPGKFPGILLMQASNACFAIGQIAWRQIRREMENTRDVDCYALLYIGAAAIALVFSLAGNPVEELLQLSGSQWLALVYLGTIASGLGFFLWNAGAARVNPASLAVFNNLKIPLAILISLTVFKEAARLESLVPGMAIILLALGWAEWASRRSITRSTEG